jgi:hypothetical protein
MALVKGNSVIPGINREVEKKKDETANGPASAPSGNPDDSNLFTSVVGVDGGI